MLTNTSMFILLLIDLLAILSMITGIIKAYTHTEKFFKLIIKYFIPSVVWFGVGQLVLLGYFDSEPNTMIVLLLSIQTLHYIIDSDRFKLGKINRAKYFNKESRVDLDLKDLPTKEELSEEEKLLEEANRIIKATGYNQKKVAEQIQKTGKVDGLWVSTEDKLNHEPREDLNKPDDEN